MIVRRENSLDCHNIEKLKFLNLNLNPIAAYSRDSSLLLPGLSVPELLSSIESKGLGLHVVKGKWVQRVHVDKLRLFGPNPDLPR
jgi:hypothetical protein